MGQMRHTKIFEPIRNEVLGKPYPVMNEQHKNATQKWTIIEKEINFTDKRVLDVGCSEGYGTIEALELGAKSAVGVDNVGWLVQVARKAKEKLEIPDDKLVFEQMDFENTPLLGFKALFGEFDFVLALGLIHHFGIHEYIKQLKKLCDLANDLLVLEMWVDVGKTGNHLREELRGWTNVIPTETYLKKILSRFGFRVVRHGVINHLRRELWVCQRIEQ